jgi:hypothetical protein
MTPLYIANAFTAEDEQLASVPWVNRTEARLECFMSPVPRKYIYGSGRGVREYFSVEMAPWVLGIMSALDGDPNVCFFNRYDSKQNALGWHSDDSPDTSMAHPISVVSFGAAREIWWRKIGASGIVPPEERKLLEPGSLFVMPAGFQGLYEHRIPKADRDVGPRVSLTFRRMLG